MFFTYLQKRKKFRIAFPSGSWNEIEKSNKKRFQYFDNEDYVSIYADIYIPTQIYTLPFSEH